MFSKYNDTHIIAISDEIYYMSVIDNYFMFSDGSPQPITPQIDKGFVEKVVGSVVNCNREKSILIDFICSGTSIEYDKTIIDEYLNNNAFILARSKFKDDIFKENNHCLLLEDEAKDEYIIASKNNSRNEELKMLLGERKDEAVEDYLREYLLAKFFINDLKENPKYSFSEGNLKYLESSNIYINRYINIKSIFLDKNYTLFIIRKMKYMITQFFNNIDDLILLGVSNTGIILAKLLSIELNRPIQCLNRLGPKYCLKTPAKELNEFKNKKYILISDVICMGGEYKMAKSIIDALGASLIGGICVVKICDVFLNDEDKKIFSLLSNVNRFSINDESINYQIVLRDF